MPNGRMAVPTATGRSAMLRRALAAMALCTGLAACTSTPPRATMTAADLQLVTAATQDALEQNRVGESANWTNPATGHLGTVTPTQTLERASGVPCRDFQQTVTVEGRTTFAYDRVCRNADGLWQSTRYGSLAEAARRAERAPATQGPVYGGHVGSGGYGGYAGYRDPWCRGGFNDPWCRRHSGLSVGVGVGF